MEIRAFLVVALAGSALAQSGSFSEAMQREVGALPLRSVGGEASGFELQVEASAAPTVVQLEGAQHLNIPLGDAGRMHCFVLPADMDLGELLTRARKGVQKGEIQRAQLMELFPIGVSPLLMAEFEYVRDGGSGLVKAAVYSSRTGSLICLHDQVGYRRSFRRWTTQVAKTLTVAPTGEERPDPTRAELQLATVGEVTIGFELRRTFEFEDGGRADERHSMVVIPKSLAEFDTYEAMRVVTSDPAGEVLKGFLLSIVGGETQFELDWTQVGPRQYAVKGTAGAEQVDFRFKSPGPLSSDAKLEAVQRELFASETKRPWKGYLYQPDAELRATLPVTLQRGAVDGERQVEMVVGPQRVKAWVDEEGAVERVELESPGGAIVQRRIATLEHPGAGFVDDSPVRPVETGFDATPKQAAVTVTNPAQLSALVQSNAKLLKDVDGLRGRQAAATGALYGGLGLGAATVVGGLLLLPPECGFEGPSGAQSCGLGLSHAAVAAGGVALAATGALVSWALNPGRADWQRVVDAWNQQRAEQPAELSKSF